MSHTVAEPGRKRTDVFPVDLVAWSAMMSLIRTVLEKWREQKSVWTGFKREQEVRNSI